MIIFSGEEVSYDEAMPYFRQIEENGGCVGEVSYELMKKIVVDDGSRPDRSEWWEEDEVSLDLIVKKGNILDNERTEPSNGRELVN